MTAALRIAISDDERDVREYLTEVLPRLGHQVVGVAETGRQLVAQSCALHPDLVISDIKMPDLDGIAAAQEVNQHYPTPFLLISAHHDADVLARLDADPIMAYLVKPISEPELKTAITVAIHRFRNLRTLTREREELRQALEERKLIERAKGIISKRLRLEEEEAFRRLRKMANDQNLKLLEVSRRVLQADEVFHHLERY